MGDPVIDYGNLVGNETLHVRGQDREGRPCGETFQCTVTEIADLAGGGGISVILEVSGESVNGVLGTYYVWNSAAASAKSIIAPPATGSGEVIKAIDMYGSAYQYNINLVPFGDDIVIGNQSAIYTDFGSQTWRDLLPGVWGSE